MRILNTVIAMPDRFHEEGLRFLKYQFGSLSSAERAVLDLIVAGASEDTIAQELAMPTRYVADYTVRLLKIFGAIDLADLIRKSDMVR